MREEQGHYVTRNNWQNAALYDDLVTIENKQPHWRFNYNMKRGYGGSGAVWSGRCWRMLPDDFITASRFNYGQDWPIRYEDLVPYYEVFEQRFGVGGPMHTPDWPWKNSFVYPSFKQSYLDQIIAKAVAPHFTLVPTANAVKNIPGDGGCLGFDTCVQHCPTNALYRPYLHLIEPHRKRENLFFTFNAVVNCLEAGSEGDIRTVGYIDKQSKEQKFVSGKKVFLCGNTIENLRILLNSKNVFGTEICNTSGLLGRKFASHGAVVFDIETTEPLYVGRGRSTTSAAINTAVHRSQAVNSYMLEVFNFDWGVGKSCDTQLLSLRKKENSWGRKLFERAPLLNHRTKLSVIFEIEMRNENRVSLSSMTDEYGIPYALVDFKLGGRDIATYNAIREIQAAIKTSPLVAKIDKVGHGLNGNHPMGGYCMGKDPDSSVVNEFSRSHDFSNLYILGGGAFSSTSCFNPTQTIAALALKCLDDPLLRANNV